MSFHSFAFPLCLALRPVDLLNVLSFAVISIKYLNADHVASIVNSVTTEGLGAGVNVSAIWWFITIAWLTILEQPVTPPVADTADDAILDARAVSEPMS